MQKSLPRGERGLKSAQGGDIYCSSAVAPPRGAWIEIGEPPRASAQISVAPPRGAWIEISPPVSLRSNEESLPRGERGLKYRGGRRHVEAGRSLPRGERGLKSSRVDRLKCLGNVAPPAGSVD